MGAKILEAVRSLGMRLRGWLPWPWKKSKPNEWFWVVADDLPDDQPALGWTYVNINTLEECFCFHDDVWMIPPDRRLRDSEYRRIREEYLRKMEEQARQQDRVE